MAHCRKGGKAHFSFLKGPHRTRPTQSLAEVIFDTLATPERSVICDTDDEIVDGVLKGAKELAREHTASEADRRDPTRPLPDC